MKLVKISAKRIRQTNMFPLANKAIAYRKKDDRYNTGLQRTFYQALVDNGKILAVMGWEVSNEKLFLGPLEVRPEYRGMGIGTYLIYRSVSNAFAYGLKGVFLYCTDALVGFYERLHFNRIPLVWDNEESNEMLLPFYGNSVSKHEKFVNVIGSIGPMTRKVHENFKED
nr:GNAT family N-acetyltransferase [uncultured Sphaerochaeta sp.]